MLGTLPELIDAATRLRKTATPFVLATIVATDGSTYRKAGARMILCADGTHTGMLGGGRFERDLLELARSVFADRRAKLVSCDMPSPKDAAPGRQWARDGGARILLQLHDADNGWQPLVSLADCLAARESAVLVTVCQSDDPAIPVGATVLTGARMSNDVPDAIRMEVDATAGAVARTGNPMLVQHPVADGEIEAFYCPIQPPLHLLLAGAGADAMPVARMAHELGWEVTVIDAREHLCRAESVPHADRVLHVQSGALPELCRQLRFDAAVLMTRNFELDAAFLEPLSGCAVSYLGLLGSKTRCAKLLETIGERAARIAATVHGPAGLALDATTPEEIALSIVAEIQSCSRNLLRSRRNTAGTPAANAEPRSAGQVHAVILAAGGSRRYGGFKQLLEFRGESMLRRISHLAAEVLENRVIVVHGPKAPKCQRELAGIDVVHAVNENWEGGIATSLRRGLRALPDAAEAVLVLLCDQPLIELSHLRELVSRWQSAPDKIIASGYAGGAGVPALFPRRWFEALNNLSGDKGARALLEQDSADVIVVDFPDAAVDIDTQGDYQALILGQHNKVKTPS